MLYFILLIILLITIFTYITHYSVFSSSKNSVEKKYIKWIDFSVKYNVLVDTASLDISSHINNEKIKYNWIELLAYLACKYGGNFNLYKKSDLTALIDKINSENNMEDLSKNLKNFSYYFESFSAVLGEFIGEYEIQDSNKNFQKKYGVKAFCPIAQNYSFSHYDDFGASRSYGYKRTHLGNDLMGSIGTPVIAVESGYIEAIGWNQYGGWRIGIRSFDKKRYYYYAHLRKDHPYAEDMYEGKIIKAGDVIGYLGMTGYSNKENVNNINVPHLHFGIQIIFDEVQKDGVNQIWIDVYQIIEFLKKYRSEVYLANPETRDFERKYDFMEESLWE